MQRVHPCYRVAVLGFKHWLVNGRNGYCSGKKIIINLYLENIQVTWRWCFQTAVTASSRPIRALSVL
jgi:hypothetical protein